MRRGHPSLLLSALQAGRWPVGASISERVLYAEQLWGVATGLAAYSDVAAATELTLLDRQRVLLGEWAPQAVGRRGPGSSAAPQGDPNDTSPAYSSRSSSSRSSARGGGGAVAHVAGAELVGGAETATRALIGYAPGELGASYARGRARAKAVAATTGGSALLEPGLVHAANYRALIRER
jgi:hypothetical protein